MEEVGFWVRNLERQEKFSFWLQTSTDKFYPDFVCKLKDGRYLVVEYKGADRWSNDDSREKRRLGEFWALKSDGKCLFVMPKGKD
jgi:type III restriction enzyme